MHELALLAIPAVAAPIYAARAWFARRRARRAGAIELDSALPTWGPLPASDGSFWGPKDLADAPATAFVFMSNRCPGVKAYDRRLNELAANYRHSGLRVVGVNSAPTSLYPGESLSRMQAAATERGLAFPYIKDENQELKRLLGATVTPQAFLVDQSGRLRYRGRIDDAFVANKATSHELRDAVDAVLTGQRVHRAETHAIGCSLDELRPPHTEAARRLTRAPVALEA